MVTDGVEDRGFSIQDGVCGPADFSPRSSNPGSLPIDSAENPNWPARDILTIRRCIRPLSGLPKRDRSLGSILRVFERRRTASVKMPVALRSRWVNCAGHTHAAYNRCALPLGEPFQKQIEKPVPGILSFPLHKNR